MDVLITAGQLAQQISGESPRILDVRWTLTAPDGRAAHQQGHLPGAVYVDLDTELADHSVVGRGRHPLPTAAALQDAARRWGLNPGDSVVVYDDWSGQAAARGGCCTRPVWPMSGFSTAAGRPGSRPGFPSKPVL